MSTRQETDRIKNLAKEVVKECFNDKVFMDNFADKILMVITKKMSDELEKQINKIQMQNTERTDQIDIKINLLEEKLNKMQKENQELKQKLLIGNSGTGNIQESNKNILNKINDIEQKSKLSELRVFGINEEKEEDLKMKLMDIFSTKLGVQNLQVENCFRIGPLKRNMKNPRPVFVKFTSLIDRDAVFYNKKKLKGTKLAITEELIKQRYELLRQAKEEFGKECVWTKSGKICVKFNDRIYSMTNLDDIGNIRNLK